MSERSPAEDANQDDTEGDTFEFRIRWPIGNEPAGLFANQFAVTKIGAKEYALEFGQFAITGFSNRTKREVEAELENVEVVRVAKIIVSEAGLTALAGILNQHLQRRFPNVVSDDDNEPDTSS